MVVRWTDIAENRLRNVFDYYLDVAGYNVAAKIVSEIINSSDSLRMMPFMAPIEKNLTGRKFIYRSLIVNKMFKVVYFVDEKADCVVIATIWDCRRDPSKLQDDVH